MRHIYIVIALRLLAVAVLPGLVLDPALATSRLSGAPIIWADPRSGVETAQLNAEAFSLRQITGTGALKPVQPAADEYSQAHALVSP
jgi:hypothetical protein